MKFQKADINALCVTKKSGIFSGMTGKREKIQLLLKWIQVY